jgi:GxxExxY protein
MSHMARRQAQDLVQGELTSSIIGAMYEVHQELGFGFREYIYSLALERVLIAKGHRVSREVSVMVYFRGEPLAPQTLDMIVDDRVVVETKSSERLHENATGQLFGYLCATKLEVGLVLHFGREARAHRVFFENRLKR